jgi:hypothetical protein
MAFMLLRLPWSTAPVDHQYRRLHGAGAEPVQGLLAGLNGGWASERAPLI